MLPPLIASSRSFTASPAHRLCAALSRLLAIFLITLAPSFYATAATQADSPFITTWATSILRARADSQTPKLDDTLLIQNVRVSAGGERVRLHLSNLYGESELVIASASLALLPEGDTNATEPKAQHTPLTFGGSSAFTIPAGEDAISDPIDFPLPALSDVAITLHIERAAATLSGHDTVATVSRSFYRPAQSTTPDRYERINRWFFIHALDVAKNTPSRGAIILLGDSITDGGGSPSSHSRWSDELARRLHSTGNASGIGIINKGVSGNCLLHEWGSAPSALGRFERDVLQQSGARWLVVHIGINDCVAIGDAHKNGRAYPSISGVIAAYEQLINRAHAAGLKVYGTTILPFKGAWIWTEIGEEYRKAINEWTRNHARYDAIIDFDTAVRDPSDPDYLAEKYDRGDFLHPSVAGLHAIAHAIDLGLFD